MQVDVESRFEAARDREGELNGRQREVLVLVARGLTNPQIAERLGMTLDGAKWNVSEILSKLGVATREEAAAYWHWRNRPTQRAHRLARAFLGIPAMAKWAAAGLVATGAGALAVVGVLAASGGGDTAAPAAPTPTEATTTPTPTPSPFGPTLTPPPAVIPDAAYPSGTRIGIPEVDAVIAAMEAGDWDALAGMVEFDDVACEERVTPFQPDALICDDGMEPDDPISGIHVSSLHGDFWRADRSQVAAQMRELFGAAPQYLHAIYDARLDTAGAAGEQAGDSVVVFTSHRPDMVSPVRYDALSLQGGAIVAIHAGAAPLGGVWDDPDNPGWVLPQAPQP